MTSVKCCLETIDSNFVMYSVLPQSLDYGALMFLLGGTLVVLANPRQKET